MNKKLIISSILLVGLLILGLIFVNFDPSLSEVQLLKSQIVELQEANTFLEDANKTLTDANSELETELNHLTEENTELKEDYQSLDEDRIAQLSKVTGLVKIEDIDDSIVLDLRYASDNNFVGEQIYPVDIALLQKDTALKLKKANELAKKDGYRIKVWDAYRPIDAQKILWEHVSDPEYVSNPSKGSDHNRGTAIDVTLVDKDGNELEMPTDFDEFSEKASRKYDENSQEAQENMEYLTKIMRQSGFSTINSEWWHFKDKNDSKYANLNVQLEYFMPRTDEA